VFYKSFLNNLYRNYPCNIFDINHLDCLAVDVAKKMNDTVSLYEQLHEIK